MLGKRLITDKQLSKAFDRTLKYLNTIHNLNDEENKDFKAGVIVALEQLKLELGYGRRRL